MHTRNNYLDFIKGIAIILVIIGHVVQYSLGVGFFENPLFIFIYSFHMPLFMGISGYLFYYSEKRSIGYIVKKRFEQLIVPLLIWTFIVYILILLKKPEANLTESLLLYFRLLPREYWFLFILFISSLLLAFTNVYLKSWYYHLIIILLMLLIPDFSSMQLLKFMYPIFLLGFMYNRHSSFINRYINYVIMASVFLFIAGLYYWKTDYFIYTTGSQILYKDGVHIEQIKNNGFRYIVGIAGSVVILYLAKIIFDKVKLNYSTIEKLGRETLGLYLVHLFLLELFFHKPLIIIDHYFYLQVFVNAVLLLLVSYLLVRLLDKSVFAKRFLLGKV